MMLERVGLAEAGGMGLENVVRSIVITSGTIQWLVIIGVLFLLSLAIILWAAFVRKRPHRRPSHYSYERPQPPPSPSEQNESPHGWFGLHRKRRKRKRRELARNPTLAETGGLPPIRPNRPQPPAPPA